jgi:hypothetical protein
MKPVMIIKLISMKKTKHYPLTKRLKITVTKFVQKKKRKKKILVYSMNNLYSTVIKLLEITRSLYTNTLLKKIGTYKNT